MILITLFELGLQVVIYLCVGNSLVYAVAVIE